jgi:hypothetical protein
MNQSSLLPLPIRLSRFNRGWGEGRGEGPIGIWLLELFWDLEFGIWSFPRPVHGKEDHLNFPTRAKLPEISLSFTFLHFLTLSCTLLKLPHFLAPIFLPAPPMATLDLRL